jgi:hypothetical protein
MVEKAAFGGMYFSIFQSLTQTGILIMTFLYLCSCSQVAEFTVLYKCDKSVSVPQIVIKKTPRENQIFN